MVELNGHSKPFSRNDGIKPPRTNCRADRITINVSGSIFETFETTLNRYPESLLGNRDCRNQYYCSKTNQYYFNRNRKTFESILFFYQSNGKLYRPSNVNLILFLEECRFFLIPEANINVVKELECAFLTDKVNDVRDLPGFECNSAIQRAVWRFLEYPNSTKQARIYFFVQMAFVVISIGIFSSESLADHSHTVDHYNDGSHFLWTNPFLIAELFISIIFGIDFLLRCIFSPHKKVHFLSVYTYIDLVCLVPYSIMTSTDDSELTTLARLLKMLRFLRVLKLIRLSTRISKKLRILFVIITDSWQDLQIFCLGVLLITFFSAAIVFCFEVTEENTKFTSIPKSMWWSLQACITLGYGDIVPQTFLGRMLSSVCMIYGLIWMMLPILALGLKVVIYGAEVRELKG
ncbi:potassium voltage-gated channel subfamily A member 2-like [Clytia hemisphaerica]